MADSLSMNIPCCLCFMLYINWNIQVSTADDEFSRMMNFRNCLSCVVTARIFLLFDLSSAVQIYVSYIYIHLFILLGYITNSQYDQLPVGLIAQLVEHCTGIAEVMGSNPVQA